MTRDEVYSPELFGGFLGEWKRDQAFFQYRLIKSLGPVGGIAIAVFMIAGALYLVASWVLPLLKR